MNGHKGTANPEYIRAMRGLRRSNAARPHDPRPHRRRTRATRLHAALSEWA